uniref:Uncharacterized protein n=1 Tax=Oryza meridionalis TaxID=40149 RepID=A0A0E0EZU7_9ORYZ
MGFRRRRPCRHGGRKSPRLPSYSTSTGQSHPLLRLIRPDSTTPLQFPHRRRGHIPPEMAISVPPVKAAAPMIPPRFQFSHLLLDFIGARTAPMWCLASEVAAVVSTPGHALWSISRNLREIN